MLLSKTITFVRQPLIEHSLFRISFISCEFQFSVGIEHPCSTLIYCPIVVVVMNVDSIFI